MDNPIIVHEYYIGLYSVRRYKFIANCMSNIILKMMTCFGENVTLGIKWNIKIINFELYYHSLEQNML